MNKKALLYIIEDPAKINDITLESLEDIAERFPYFHVAHVLLAKGAQEVEPVQAPNKIRRAAVYAYNRNLLRDLLNQEAQKDKASNETEDGDLASTETITVENETVSFFDAIEEKEESVVLDTFPEKNEIDHTSKVQAETKELSIDFDENQDEHYAIDLYNEGKIEEAKEHFHKLILRYPDKKDYYVNQANLLMDNTYEFDESLVAKTSENIVKPAETPDSKVDTENTTETSDEDPLTEGITVEKEEGVGEVSDDTETSDDQKQLDDAFPADRLITDENIDLSDKIVIDLGQELDEYEAFELYKEGKVEEARAHFDKLILRYPDKKEYFLSQANLLLDNTYEFDESLKDKVFYRKPTPAEPEQTEITPEEPKNVPIPGAEDLGHPELEDSFDLLREVEPTVKKTIKIDPEDLNEDLAIAYYKRGDVDAAGEVYQQLMRKYPTRKEYFQTQYDLLTKNPRLFGIGIDDAPAAVEEPAKLDEKVEEKDDSAEKEELKTTDTSTNEEVAEVKSEDDFRVEVKLPNDYIPYNPLLLEDPFELIRNEDYVVDAFDVVRDKLEFNGLANVHMQDVVQPLELVDLSKEEEGVIASELSDPADVLEEKTVEDSVEDTDKTEVAKEEEGVIASELSDPADVLEDKTNEDAKDETSTEIDLFDQVRTWEEQVLAGKPHTLDDEDDLDLFELVRHWETDQLEGKVVHDEQVADGFDAFDAVRLSETDQIDGKVVHDEQVADGFDAFESVRLSETDQIDGKVVHDEQVADGFDAFESVRLSETDQIDGKVVHDEQVADGFDAFEAVRVSETDQIDGKVVHDEQVADGFDAFEAVRVSETDQIDGKVVHDEQVADGFDAFESVRVSETDQIDGKVVHDEQVADGFDAFESVRVSETDQIDGKVVHDEQVADGFDAFESVRVSETDQIDGKVVHDEQVADGFDAFEAVRVSETDQIDGKVVHDEQVADGFDAFEAVRDWETEQLAQNQKVEDALPSVDNKVPEQSSVPVAKEDENMNEGIAMDLFNEGRTDEAITMYLQLIAKYPEKKEYYEGQLAIIADDVDLSTVTTDALDSTVDKNNLEPESPTQENVPSTSIEEKRMESNTLDDVKPPVKKERNSQKEIESSEPEPTTDFFQSIDTDAYLEPETTPKVEEKPLDNQSIEHTPKIEKAPEMVEAEESKVSESAAIFLFNQGRNEEAIDIYRQLMAQQPARNDYFLAQISILQNEPFIAEQVTSRPEPTPPGEMNKDTEEADGEDEDFVSESTALILFNQGKVDEAIQVFERLKEQYPEKAAHFDSQIDILRS